MQHVDDALLVAYADDALTPSERGAVEAHLVSCAECRARVEEERALAQRAAAVLGFGAPDEAAVPSFEDVLRRTERTDATSAATIDADRTRRRSLKPLALAATLIVALGAGWIARVLFLSPEFNAPAQRTETATDDAAESAAARGEPVVPSAPGAAGQPAGGAADQAAAPAEAADPQGYSAIEEMRAQPDVQQAQPRAAPPDADAPAAALLRRATDSTADARARVAAARDTTVSEQRADERVVAVAAAPPPPMPAQLPAEKSAPGLGAVAGRIIDATTRQPLVGAQVGVAGTNLGALTGPDGNYVIRDVPPGRRDVRAALIGYAEVSLPVTVEADTSVTANLAVRPAAVALESVTVADAAAAPEAGGIAAADAAWQGTSVAAASARGTVVRGVPDAPVELVWIGRSGAPWRVRVVQRIDGAAVEIVEWRGLGADAAGSAGTLPDGRSYVFTTSGGAAIRLRADLPLARLRVLAGQVAPLQ